MANHTLALLSEGDPGIDHVLGELIGALSRRSIWAHFPPYMRIVRAIFPGGALYETLAQKSAVLY